MSIEKDTKAKMQAAIEHFKQELKNLRSNRANPAMLDSVMVEVYGANMRLRDLATVSAAEARQLLISPFDPQTANPIGKAIERANLNVQPVVDGNVIRINIPPMDENMRRDIAKLAKRKAEEAKVTIRDVRRKANETVRKQKADSEITEDIQKKEEKLIQELTDKFCQEVDDLYTEKEKEIMTV